MTLRAALDRTLLLMRDELHDAVDDSRLVSALTSTEVALITDNANMASHAAQTAFVTAAMLMARSGHRVFLIAPDLPLVGPQPPLTPGGMIERLLAAGKDMIPGVQFSTVPPPREIDLAIAFGSAPLVVAARRRLRMNASAWEGKITPADVLSPWQEPEWPMGAMVAAGLAAAEAFKIGMQKLRPFARNPQHFAERFAESDEHAFSIAPPNTPRTGGIGKFDCISCGAITNAVLYALARIPDIRGQARVIEPDFADISNLNRYMLLLRSRVEEQKAYALADMSLAGIKVEPIPMRYEPGMAHSVEPMAPAVLVGVDDIPTRWEVQKAGPAWLGVGATTHRSAMASFHREGIGCAKCLHPYDDPDNAPIPTVSVVSFWAGLLLAAYFLRHAAGDQTPLSEQQTYMNPFHPEKVYRAPVPIRKDCAVCRVRMAS